MLRTRWPAWSTEPSTISSPRSAPTPRWWSSRRSPRAPTAWWPSGSSTAPAPSSRSILPLAVDEYARDFHTPASLAEFQALLGRAASVRVVPSDTAAPREEAYEAAGLAMLDRADVVLALWDGEESRGRGGTAEMVQVARDRRPPRGGHPGEPGGRRPRSRRGDGRGVGLVKLLDSPRRRWYLLAGGWLALVVLGMGGFIQQSNEGDLDRSFLDNLYLTLQLATLDYEGGSENLNWRLQIARFVAPVMAAGTVLQTATGRVPRPVHPLADALPEGSHDRVRSRGGREPGWPWPCTENGEQVVGIDAVRAGPGSGHDARARDPRPWWATRPTRRRCRAPAIDRAARVVVLCDNDARNVSVTAAVRGIGRDTSLPGAAVLGAPHRRRAHRAAAGCGAGRRSPGPHRVLQPARAGGPGAPGRARALRRRQPPAAPARLRPRSARSQRGRGRRPAVGRGGGGPAAGDAGRRRGGGEVERHAPPAPGAGGGDGGDLPHARPRGAHGRGGRRASWRSFASTRRRWRSSWTPTSRWR